MDFVNEKHVAFFQTREKPGQFAGFFDHRATGVFDVHAHRVRDDVRKRGLSQTGRSA